MLDTLLDQEGLEVDPVDRLEKDIPLHKAVRFVNGLDKNEWEAGAGVVELLLDAGADPRSVLLLSFFALEGGKFRRGFVWFTIWDVGVFETH